MLLISQLDIHYKHSCIINTYNLTAANVFDYFNIKKHHSYVDTKKNDVETISYALRYNIANRKLKVEGF